ncbi:MAG: hypothetical protein HYU97_04745 [Deltaproteobacteria bacterium]|nr:hypothetical protein [Deltaproteobacteria bacterium]
MRLRSQKLAKQSIILGLALVVLLPLLGLCQELCRSPQARAVTVAKESSHCHRQASAPTQAKETPTCCRHDAKTVGLLLTKPETVNHDLFTSTPLMLAANEFLNSSETSLKSNGLAFQPPGPHLFLKHQHFLN